MRLRAALLATLLCCAGCGLKDPAPDQPVHNPFPNASELRLFVETGSDGKGQPVFSKPKGLVLTASQRAQFESQIAVHTYSPNDSFAACFIPHHFFRYFDKAGKQVGEIDVCFCCAGVEASDASNIHLAENQMLTANFAKLESFIQALGERTDVQCGGETPAG